jgi:hypothetical protein
VKDLLMIGGIGVGAYLVYQYLTSSQAASLPVSSAAPLPTANNIEPAAMSIGAPPTITAAVASSSADLTGLKAQLQTLLRQVNGRVPGAPDALQAFLAANPALGVPTNDQIHSELLAMAQADPAHATGSGSSISATPWQWNTYLSQVPGVTKILPSPGLVVDADPNQPMTLETYWAGMSQWLINNYGLGSLDASGLSYWMLGGAALLGLALFSGGRR